MKTVTSLLFLLFLTIGFMVFVIPDNPIQDDKYEQEMKKENMKVLGYTNPQVLDTKYIVELPEEIGQANTGDLLQVICKDSSLILLGFYPSHTCIDSTHNTCDGECECDGLDCR
jgi:hypothetical protein